MNSLKLSGSKHNYFLKKRNWSNIDKNLKLLLEICQLFCTNFKLNTWPWEQKSKTWPWEQKSSESKFTKLDATFMPTRVISMETQLHQFIIVFSFKLKTFIGSHAGSLLTFNSPLAKPLKKKAKRTSLCPFLHAKTISTILGGCGVFLSADWL